MNRKILYINQNRIPKNIQVTQRKTGKYRVIKNKESKRKQTENGKLKSDCTSNYIKYKWSVNTK